MFHLDAAIWLPADIDAVFPFFDDARNLQAMTPPWLDFTIVGQRPDEMRAGTVIDYRLRLHGLGFRWRSVITDWEPPERFVDVQASGPYLSWVHEHTFEPQDGGTWVRDLVTYRVLGGALVQRLLVAPDLKRIFAYRHDRLEQHFGTGRYRCLEV